MWQNYCFHKNPNFPGWKSSSTLQSRCWRRADSLGLFEVMQMLFKRRRRKKKNVNGVETEVGGRPPPAPQSVKLHTFLKICWSRLAEQLLPHTAMPPSSTPPPPPPSLSPTFQHFLKIVQFSSELVKLHFKDFGIDAVLMHPKLQPSHPRYLNVQQRATHLSVFWEAMKNIPDFQFSHTFTP